MEINDLFKDVCDGIMLIKLLEILSNEKLGKPNRGRMRVHKIENLNKVLQYLKQRVSDKQKFLCDHSTTAVIYLFRQFNWKILERKISLMAIPD